MEEWNDDPGEDSRTVEEKRRDAFEAEVDRKWDKAFQTFSIAAVLGLIVLCGIVASGKYTHHWLWAIPLALGTFAVLVQMARAVAKYNDLTHEYRNKLGLAEEDIENIQLKINELELLYQEFRPTQEQVDKVLKRYALRIKVAPSPDEVEDEIRAYQDLGDLVASRGYLTGSWQQHVRDEASEPPVEHV